MSTLHILFTYLFLGLLLIGVAIPLLYRKVKPNWIYGFRTPKTLSDPDIWYDANAYAGAALMVAGGIVFVAAPVLAIFLGWNYELYSFACTMVMLAALGWAVVKSFNYLKRL